MKYVKIICGILTVAVSVMLSCNVEGETFESRSRTTLPQLTTSNATNITTNSASLGGNITDAGSPTYTERGICYAITQNPTTANNKIPVTGTGTGNFIANMSGLSTNTTFYVRAYAINLEGTAYGEQVSFTTQGSRILPTLTTIVVTNITPISATLCGNITNVGSPTYTERGVCYATTPNPTTANNKIPVIGTSIGNFCATVNGLTPNITYYVRAYAINTEGTAYGNEVIFITKEMIFDQGTGTQANPYIITTPVQLDAVRNDLSAHYKLGNNIDLTAYLASGGAGYAKWGTSGWEPLGRDQNFFSGSFDGVGYKISGLWINLPSTNAIGLFGVISSATIQNLGVENANDNGGIKGYGAVGGIVGHAWLNCSITNCYSTGIVSSSGSNVGGVVGFAPGSSITNCYSTCTVSSSAGSIGGVAGFVSNDGSITNCYATGAISGDWSVGGVVGHVTSGGNVTNCVALNTSVTFSSGGNGRVIGYNDGGTHINNWARNDMTLSPKTLNIGINTEDGADCEATPSGSWWTTATPNGPGWSSYVWYFATGQLPKLRWEL